MKHSKGAWIFGFLCVLCMIFVTAADYFDFFSCKGICVSRFNLDFLSIVIGNGVVILLFIIAYALIDSRDIEKEDNKRRTALVILKNVYSHCKEVVELFGDDFSRMYAVKKCDLSKVAIEDNVHMHFRRLPFADNNDTIVGFAQDGILKKKEIETYFEIKKKYVSYIDLSIIYSSPEDYITVRPSKDKLLSVLAGALEKIEEELKRDDD